MPDSPALAPDSAAAQPVEQPLSQWQRLIYIFFAPSKTFASIRSNASWWVPFVLTALIGYGFTYAVQTRVGWETVVENTIQQSTRQQERIATMSPRQAATLKKGIGMSIQIFAYAFPLISLVLAAIVSAVLLGTMNFVFGGRAKFGQMMAVYYYSTFPLNLKYVLAAIVLFAISPDQFRLQNPIGSNVGYYLSLDAPKWWMVLASRTDIFTVWVLILFSIGSGIVARAKLGQAAKAVIGWWVLLTVIAVAWAAMGA